MKSIKPGRGPSMMSGAVGIVMICFGLLWTALAASLSPIFAIFGILWTAIAVMNTVYNFKNATGKNRYSSYDIVDSREETDPLNERYGRSHEEETYEGPIPDEAPAFCPWCGNPVEDGHRFCSRCGKELPRD